MRYLGILSLAALLAALPMGCSQRDTPFAAPEAGGSVSATEVGKLLPPPEPDGRWTVIYYWAIWCAPCRVEIPKLNVFADEMADSTAVYGVNYDNPAPAEHLAQAAELGIAFPMLAEDPAGHLDYARPTVLPTTMIIAPDGEVQARLIGPQTVKKLREAMRGVIE